MKLVPIADAKAHLSEIVATLAPGEEIVVTRHGVPVAKVVGVAVRDRARDRETVKRVRDRAERLKLGFSTDDLVNLGKTGRL
jgi:prevent-host-death family protein